MYDSRAEHRRFSYLVYLDGIEVPAESVTVTNSVWAFPTASIQLPPDRLLRRLGYEDRMRATVFYLDTWREEQESKLRQVAKEKAKRKSPRSNSQWRLIFDGEVVDHTYTNAPQGRSMSLNCIDLASAMSQMKIFFLMSIANIVQKVTDLAPREVAGATYRPIFPASLFFRGFNQHQGSEIKRPFDFIDNALRALFGDVDVDPFAIQTVREQIPDAEPSQLKSVVGLHFFGKWARKVNFHRRWIPMPVFENRFIREGQGAFPVLKAVQGQQAIGAMNHTAGRIGDNGSIWDLLRAIFSQMYYEVGLISTPSAVQVTRKTGEIIGPSETYVPPAKKSKEQIEQEKEIALESSEDARALAQKELGVEQRSLSEEDRIAEARERHDARSAELQASFQPQDSVTGVENRLTSYVTKPQLLFAVPPACNVVWHSLVMRHQYNEDYRNQPTRLVISEGTLFNTIAGDKINRNVMEYINLIQAVGFPREAQEGLDLRLGRNGNKANAYINPHNHLVFPEEFFKGPVYINRSIPPWFMYLQFSQDDPASNNLAGNHFQSIATSLENFILAEKKKLTGRTELEAQDKLQKLETLDTQIDAAKARSTESPQAVYEWQALVTAAEKLGNPKEKTDTLLDMLREVSTSDGAISSQRVYRLYARYEYYREKYAKRNGAATLLFNPYIVPGYPIVLWDDEETQYHLFAYAVTVTHSMTAQSAQTTVNYSFGRTFGEFYDELIRTRQEQGETTTNEADPLKLEKLTKENKAQLSVWDQAAQEQRNEQLATGEITVEQHAELARGREKELEQQARELARQALQVQIDAVPANPINDIRIQFQRNADAADVYLKLFWRNVEGEFPVQDTREPIFDVWDMVSFVERTNAGEVEKQIPTSGETDFESLDVGFVPSKKYKRYAENPDEAMKFASRPICTLTEWIDLQRERGIPMVPAAPGEPLKLNSIISADDPKQGKGAPYAVKILDLAPGPGDAPERIPSTGNIKAPINADTRRDWQSILLRFREKFYHEDEPKLA